MPDKYMQDAIGFFILQKTIVSDTNEIKKLQAYYNFDDELMSQLKEDQTLFFYFHKIIGEKYLLNKPSAITIKELFKIKKTNLSLSDEFIEVFLTRPLLRIILNKLIEEKLPLPTSLDDLLKEGILTELEPLVAKGKNKNQDEINKSFREVYDKYSNTTHRRTF